MKRRTGAWAWRKTRADLAIVSPEMEETPRAVRPLGGRSRDGRGVAAAGRPTAPTALTDRAELVTGDAK